MAGCPQGRAIKGSQKWLQAMVNDCPKLLDAAIGRESDEISAPIRWVSPLADDGFEEYRDGAFLARLGIRLDCVSLGEFWPPNGPCWDALGKTDSGQVILLEAKAHVKEAVGSPSQASEKSLPLIHESIESVKSYVGRRSSSADWTTSFYQYANRLAHLYLLRTLNKVPAFLVNLYFLNADEMASTGTIVPKTIAEWQSAITLQERFLGIRPRHPLSQYAIHAFADVNDIKRALKTSSEWSSE